MAISAPVAFSFRNSLSILFKRRRMILLVFGVALTAVAVGVVLTQPMYQATATVMVKLGRENVLSAQRLTDAQPPIFIEQQEVINSELKILQSRSLVEKVVQEIGPETLYPKLRKKPRVERAWLDAIGSALRGLQGSTSTLLATEEGDRAIFNAAVIAFQDHLAVEAVKKSNIILVRFKHEDPVMAAAAVNRLAESYLELHVEVHRRNHSTEFFGQQSEFLQSKIAKTEQTIMDLKKTTNITSLKDQQSQLLRQHGDLRSDLNQSLSQEVQIGRRIRELRQQLAATPATIPQRVEEEVNNQLINTLQGRLVELELREKDLLNKYKEDSRLVVNVREEIAVVRQKLADQEKRLYGRSMTGINPAYQRIQEDLLKSETDLRAVQAKISKLKEQLEDYQRELDKISPVEMELDRLAQQLEVERNNYRLYLSKFEESRISSAMDSEKITNVSLVERAQPALRPSSPSKLLLFAAGTIMSLLASIGLAVFIDCVSDHVERPEDLERILDVPVLTSIPDFQRPLDPTG
jgi:uncharacterized protein involved in exopolysaccharide biosynthesis